VHGRVVEGVGRRLADLDLEAGSAQRRSQVGDEPPLRTLAVVDDDVRLRTVASEVDPNRPWGENRSIMSASCEGGC